MGAGLKIWLMRLKQNNAETRRKRGGMGLKMELKRPNDTPPKSSRKGGRGLKLVPIRPKCITVYQSKKDRKNWPYGARMP
jgi:hypothetical protein